MHASREQDLLNKLKEKAASQIDTEVQKAADEVAVEIKKVVQISEDGKDNS